ncbi:MAG TPA: hypothetical protein VGB24_24205 [Longimicrobium sp.]|uniref:hypothetical protein n=1 Tax=Longimicrobium sp. TaxID=2029185 RepID=UPI002EDB69CC
MLAAGSEHLIGLVGPDIGTIRLNRKISATAGRLVGLGMRIVPGRYRLGAAVHLAGVLAPALRRTWAFGKLRFPLNSERDLCVHLLIRCMIASGTPFDLRLRVEGADLLDAALASGRGTVIVAPHALLSLLILRYLHDRGHSPVAVANAGRMEVAGTGAFADTVPPSPNIMRVVARRLREGAIVCAMIDRVAATVRKTTRFETAVGALRISDAIFRVAVRTDAMVIFTAARVDRGRLCLVLAAPQPGSEGSADAIAGEFIGFLQAHAVAVAGAS